MAITTLPSHVMATEKRRPAVSQARPADESISMYSLLLTKESDNTNLVAKTSGGIRVGRGAVIGRWNVGANGRHKPCIEGARSLSYFI